MIDKRGRWGRESPRSDGNFVFTEFDHETLNNIIRDYLQQFGIKMSNKDYHRLEIYDRLNYTRAQIKSRKSNKAYGEIIKELRDHGFSDEYLMDYMSDSKTLDNLSREYDKDHNYFINLYKNSQINPYSYNTAITYPFINIFNSQHKK